MKSGEYMILAKVNQCNQILKSYAEAMQLKENRQWLGTMKEELTSLKENETWKLMDRPAGVKVIQNRWVFCIKSSNDDNNPRFKLT